MNQSRASTHFWIIGLSLLGASIFMAVDVWHGVLRGTPARFTEVIKEVVSPRISDSQVQVFSPTPQPDPEPLPLRVLHAMSFAAQAPFGDWSDPRQQDACEESSVIMAVHWARGKNLTKQEMLDEIQQVSVWGEARFGTYRDTSAGDTLDFITEYYEHDNARVQYGISLDDMKSALAAGNVLLVPVNGQALAHPSYTPPGPIYHFIVIKGYDENTQEFITNDPGVTNGESWRYSYSRVFTAMRDYPTGYHEKMPATPVKAMIIVGKDD